MPEQILLPQPNLPSFGRRKMNWSLVIVGVILVILIGGGIISYQKGLLPLEKILPAQLLMPEEEIKEDYYPPTTPPAEGEVPKPVEEYQPLTPLPLEPAPKYSQTIQSIGQPAQDLRLNKIRIGDHIDFFRIVFDIKNLDGSDVSIIPLTKASYLSEENEIEIEIQGIQKNLAGPGIGEKKKIWDPVVSSYTQQEIENKAVKYIISLNKSLAYFLHSRLDPARIIVDIEK